MDSPSVGLVLSFSDTIRGIYNEVFTNFDIDGVQVFDDICVVDIIWVYIPYARTFTLSINMV